MGIRKTFQYKAVVNQETVVHATEWLSLCQQLYNLCLEQRILIYKHRKKSLSKYDQLNELPEFKKAFPEFKVVGSQVLQDVVERVDKAFKGFFSRVKTKKGKAGFPRFRSRDRYDSFTLKQSGWKLHGKYLEVTGVGTFKLFLSRPIEGTIKTVTIKRTSWGDWYVSFSCENVPAKSYPVALKEQTGIDVNLVNYCTDSDPESDEVANPRYYVKSQKQLRRRQRKVSRRTKGSHRQKKAKRLVAKTHAKVARQRKDFLHKTANHYIKTYQRIGIEDLKVANMKRNHHLSKHISDAGWSLFFELLFYKAEEAGRQVIKVKPHFSTQECSRCHVRVSKTLSQRVHNCVSCGLILGRDKNSANIIESRVGQTLQALT